MGLLPTHHKPSQDLHGNTGGGAASTSGKVPGITAALFYGFMSIAAVFLNKAIFEVWKYRYPASLVAGQTVFTVVAIACLSQLGVIKIGAFNPTHFKRVFVVSAVFQLKLVLDMSALVLVNIPMYGILKSATTPFVMLLDFVIRRRVPTGRVQAAVWLTTTGGLVAGYGDLAFDPLGYALALSSAACTACYVVLVGKIGDELQLDSFTLLLYNSLWSTPLSAAIAVLTGEVAGVATFPHLYELPFVVAFLTSCASAFVLNYATYLCTRLNDALTTSVVGRTKSVVQGVGGLFAFSVEAGLVNVGGLTLNSMGILWYAYERYADERRRRGIGARSAELRKLSAREGGDATAHFMSRNESQLTLSPKVVDSNGRALVQQNGGFGAGTHARHPNRGGEVDGGGAAGTG
jgi:solute carrier family 35 protein